MNAYECFKIFEKHNLELAKKKDIDYIKEVYSQTEVFDISRVNEYTLTDKLEAYLPFESCFILNNQSEFGFNSIYLHLFLTNDITGSCFEMTMFEDRIFQLNLPFVVRDNTIHFTNKETLSNYLINILEFIGISKMTPKKLAYLKGNMQLKELFDKNKSIEEIKKIIRNSNLELVEPEQLLLGRIKETLEIVNSKSNTFSIYTDKTNKSEYYTFKNKHTLKIPSRTIYYYLDKNINDLSNIKPLTKLEYSHSFRVRGHWRKLNSNVKGKNSKGEYIVKGYTWVNDFTKGKGELVHKVRRIK